MEKRDIRIRSLTSITIAVSSIALVETLSLSYNYYIKHVTGWDNFGMGIFDIFFITSTHIVLFILLICLIIMILKNKKQIKRLSIAACAIGAFSLITYAGGIHIFKEPIYLLSYNIPVQNVALSYNNSPENDIYLRNNVFYYNSGEMGFFSYSYHSRRVSEYRLSFATGAIYAYPRGQEEDSFNGKEVIYVIRDDGDMSTFENTKGYGEEGYVYFGRVKNAIDWNKYQDRHIDLKYQKMTKEGYVFFAYTDSELDLGLYEITYGWGKKLSGGNHRFICSFFHSKRHKR